MDRQTLSFAIEGMHCGGCVRRVTMALEKLEDVEVVRVDVGSAEVKCPPDMLDAPIVAAIERLGFKAVCA
jgi:copper chaperone